MTKITSENWLEAPNNKESFQKVLGGMVLVLTIQDFQLSRG